MSPPSPAPASVQEAEAALAAVRDGDQDGFAALAYRHHRELHVHCYRMLGSFQDAEDAAIGANAAGYCSGVSPGTNNGPNSVPSSRVVPVSRGTWW